MKKIVFVCTLIVILSSCKALVGTNYEKLTKKVDLGMTKQEVIKILGKDYYIESLSETYEGKLEVLTFYDVSIDNQRFTFYFLNDTLKEFHKYIPPYPPHDIRVIKE